MVINVEVRGQKSEIREDSTGSYTDWNARGRMIAWQYNFRGAA